MQPLLTGLQNLALVYIDVPALRPGSVGAYLFAFLCAAAATALRLAIDPFVVGVQYITFFPAVMITTLISGFGAGVFCVALSVAALSFLVLPRELSFYAEYPGEVLANVIFVLVTLINVILISTLRLAFVALRDSQERLEAVVSELQHRTRNLISVIPNDS
jgi:K+-sensing histidine kinase KdpD